MKVKLSFKKRKEIVSRLGLGESVYRLSKEYKISRVLIYRLKRRSKISTNLLKPGTRLPRASRVPLDIETEIIDLVLTYPQLSSHKIYQLIKGKLPLGKHGIYNLMRRYNLNRYQFRVEVGKQYALDKKSNLSGNKYLVHERK